MFFKWIKRHLRFKAFYGTSENAVKTQMWIALSVNVLEAIAHNWLGLDSSVHKSYKRSGRTLFEKFPLPAPFSPSA